MRALASVSPIHSFFFWGGWSALVAIGTLSLAFATYSLVRASKRLALNADAELRAQWRPILIARGSMVSRQPVAFTISIENVGRGPALSVRCKILDAWADPRLEVVAPEELKPFHWHGVVPDGEHTVGALYCEDISGGFCTTVFSVTNPGHEVRNLSTSVDYSDPFNVAWWQRPLRRRIVDRRIAKLMRGPGSESTGAQDGAH